MENTTVSSGSDSKARQRFVYGLALAYRLFNVVELVESVVRGHSESKLPRHGSEDATADRVVRLEATPSAERAYIARVASLKRLNPEEELALARRMQDGDEIARNLLVSANLGLVVMFARKYSRAGASVIDLVAEGNIGLLQATRTFDPERGFRFATYAKRPIAQAMVRALPRLIGALTVPMPKQTSQESRGSAESKELEAGVSSASGRGDGDAERKFGQNAWATLPPIPDPVEIPADEEYEPVNQLDDLLRNQTLRRALQCLKAREREIVTARFGLDELEPQTLASLARRYEISIERVRQIERAGLKRLAQYFDKTGHSLETML